MWATAQISKSMYKNVAVNEKVKNQSRVLNPQ